MKIIEYEENANVFRKLPIDKCNKIMTNDSINYLFGEEVIKWLEKLK